MVGVYYRTRTIIVAVWSNNRKTLQTIVAWVAP